MLTEFKSFIDSLEPKVQLLMEMNPFKYSELPKHLPKKGIYLFSEGNTHLYVGRTNRLKERLRGHCCPGATYHSATFAFRIAREETGSIKATYKREGSRANLIADDNFASAFLRAKKRISKMDIRFVEEVDPVKQALLEVCVATILKTPFNDFDNH